MPPTDDGAAMVAPCTTGVTWSLMVSVLVTEVAAPFAATELTVSVIVPL